MPVDPMDGFPPETFRARRERVLERLEGSAMVLPAAPVRYASRDTEYPYRPDSELFWATGVAEPEAVAVLRGHADEDDPERFTLFVRPRDEKAELWTGRRLGPEGAADLFGADATWSTEELGDRLPDLLEGADVVHYRLGASDATEGLVRAALARARSRGARKGVGPRGVLDPGVILDPLRRVKDADEIQRIRQAATISAEAHRNAMTRAREGMGEWEVQALLEATFRGLGGDGPAYGTIVASGSNACVLHYVGNAHTLDAGDLVLVDAGASLGLYAGDITRSWPVSGTFTPEQLAVYKVVDRARQHALEAVRPGATVADVHDASVRALTEGLVAMKVLEGKVDDLVERKAYEAYFPHQTSHWLGLDVHDVGDYASGGTSVALEPGMVLTVEPGLYFAPGSEGSAARFACIGVRIEDDVVVTEGGADVLTDGVPTDPDVVVELVGSAAG